MELSGFPRNVQKFHLSMVGYKCGLLSMVWRPESMEELSGYQIFGLFSSRGVGSERERGGADLLAVERDVGAERREVVDAADYAGAAELPRGECAKTDSHEGVRGLDVGEGRGSTLVGHVREGEPENE